MNKKIRALIWEQWRQSNGVTAAAVAILVVYASLPLLLTKKMEQELIQDNDLFAPIPWVAVVLGIAGLFIHGTRSDLRLTFPRHRFYLPVATWRLVLVQLGYKLAAAVLLAGAASVFSSQLYGQPTLIVPAILFFVALTAPGRSILQRGHCFLDGK